MAPDRQLLDAAGADMALREFARCGEQLVAACEAAIRRRVQDGEPVGDACRSEILPAVFRLLAMGQEFLAAAATTATWRAPQ